MLVLETAVGLLGKALLAAKLISAKLTVLTVVIAATANNGITVEERSLPWSFWIGLLLSVFMRSSPNYIVIDVPRNEFERLNGRTLVTMAQQYVIQREQAFNDRIAFQSLEDD